jgi:hypothetical protein
LKKAELHTLIVGGGIAGLGCAQLLSRHSNHRFKLVSPDIGGRVIHGPSNVPYGAYWIRADYWNLKPFIKRTRRLRLGHFVSDNSGNPIRLTEVVKKHRLAYCKFLMHLAMFSIFYWIFKILCKYFEQEKIFSKLPPYGTYYKMSAGEYVDKFGLNELEKSLFDPLCRASAISRMRELPALGLFFVMMISFLPVFEFSMDWQKMIQPFAGAIVRDRVSKLTKNSEGTWTAELASGEQITAQTVVLAIPHQEAKKLVALAPKTGAISCHFWHLRGVPRPVKEDFIFYVLDPDGADIGFVKQQDGSFLFHSRDAEVDLGKYFEDGFQIIHQATWDPAFYMGNEIFPNIIGPQLILAGDYNTQNMDDTFLNGRHAAKCALKLAKY